MKIPSKILLLGALAFSMTQHADAISVSLAPSGQNIGVGGHAILNIVISGLTPGSAPAIGAFDFELSYDSSLLSASSVSFGSGLDLGINLSSQFFDLTTPGVILVSELSFESAADLIASSQGSFTLATLDLIGLSLGTSPVSFTLVDLSDQDGMSLIDVSSMGAEVTVSGGSTAVADASNSLCGLLTSLAGLALACRLGKL